MSSINTIHAGCQFMVCNTMAGSRHLKDWQALLKSVKRHMKSRKTKRREAFNVECFPRLSRQFEKTAVFRVKLRD